MAKSHHLGVFQRPPRDAHACIVVDGETITAGFTRVAYRRAFGHDGPGAVYFLFDLQPEFVAAAVKCDLAVHAARACLSEWVDNHIGGSRFGRAHVLRAKYVGACASV